jgi:glycosyltransferase involved in cell wall biosynthesis
MHYICSIIEIDMTNFSIIIPHKNIPELLERCLASIPQRDDIQIVVVDDDSAVETRLIASLQQICHSYNAELILAKDKKRRGAGYARNIGLECAKGKWIVLADADDFFNNPAFENAMEKYRDCDADMICFSNNAVDSDDITIAKENLWFSMHERLKFAIEQNNFDIIRYDTGVVWARFIKHDLVKKHKIRFQETICRNDTFFAVQIGCVAKEIILDNSLEIYCYTQRKNSLLSIHNSKTGRKTCYKVSKTVMQYLRKQRKGLEVFNGDMLFQWKLLKEENKMLYIKELPTVFLLTTRKRLVIQDFKQWIKVKILSYKTHK